MEDNNENLEIKGEFLSLEPPKKHTAQIKMGNFIIQVKDITFTKRQIKNMKKYFGWEVENLNEQ